MTVRLDAGERALLDGMAAAEDRPVSVMARRLIVAGLQASALGPRTQRLIDAGPAGLPVREVVRPPDLNSRLPTPARDHEFRPQSQNALRCVTCGGKKGEHRG